MVRDSWNQGSDSRAGPARGVVLAACLVLAVRGSRGRLSVVAEQVTGLDPRPDPSRGWARGRTVGCALSWARGPSREILDSKTNHGGSRSSRREGQGETGGPTTS